MILFMPDYDSIIADMQAIEDGDRDIVKLARAVRDIATALRAEETYRLEMKDR
jgi:hypothetical protein